MSGTSLDGLDIACCEFQFNRSWKFAIIHAETLPYSEEWEARIRTLPSLSGEDLIRADREYGRYLGMFVNEVLKRTNFHPDFIASHGHTVFHNPEKGYTLQIGDGNAIAAITGLPVIFDFRSADIALGGQGAPLVPVGDKHLFSEFPYCLNLGGISNISFVHKGESLAFDICPVNIVLNYLSAKKNAGYDDKGRIAASGQVIQSLLTELNSLDFYFIEPPKSLGREWVEQNIFPVLNKQKEPVENLLRTYTEHIAIQVAKVINHWQKGQTMVSGGGAKNDFLIERIRKKIKSDIIIPANPIVDFKEAVIFAFLGVLRWRSEINCLSSVTGATSDSTGGVIAQPFRNKR